MFRRFWSIFDFFVKAANPPKYRACRSKSRFGPSRCESCYASPKIDENRPENRTQIVENRVSGPFRRPFRSTFTARSRQNRAERREEADRGSQGAQASPIVPALASQHARTRPSWTSWQASLGNIVIDIYTYTYIYIYVYIRIWRVFIFSLQSFHLHTIFLPGVIHRHKHCLSQTASPERKWPYLDNRIENNALGYRI